MELTIEQKLQQDITAHKEGKLQDAERLYRAILQSQPAHPDANYNLGVLEVSVDRADAALPLFKTALEANLKIEQFWLSYIDALIKEKQFDNAKQVLEQAKKHGVDGEKLNNLKAQLSSKKLNSITKTVSPPKELLSSLLEHYQNGRFIEAEKLAVSITNQFPKHKVGWKLLGAILRKTGRKSEAVDANQTLVALSPRDALAHFTLGITLKELGKFDEAEASYKQAIVLKSDFAEAHYNLGLTLHGQGRLGEAEASYNQAIVLKPDYAKVHSKLAVMLQELGRLEESEASCAKAIALKPEDFKTHNQLLICLFLQDKKYAFFDELDYLNNHDKTSAIIGSLACRAALKYGLEKPNSFCTKPLNYVLHNDLNSRYDFEKIFVKKAEYILKENWISNRRQALLVNGNQTSGNIFDLKNDYTNEIQNIIRNEIEKYRAKFNKSEEGLIKKMPSDYSIYGWLISMESGGNIKPHIHEEGWLSGSIYINVPQKLKADSGNLVVSLGTDNDAIDTRKNEKITINVVTGSMVLFPASLMHYTIPFESKEERIVLAFDVKEK